MSSERPLRSRDSDSAGIWTTGSGAADRALGGRLPLHAPHEIAPYTALDAAAALGFACGLLARAPTASDKPILWIDLRAAAIETGALHPPGLLAFGLDPSRFLSVAAQRPSEALGAAEEGAKSGASAAILVRAPAAFTPSRRLVLAAAAGRTPIVIVAPGPIEGAAAFSTRWRIAARPSAPDPFDPHAPGRPAFDVALKRARQGRPGRFMMEWRRETRTFGVPAELAARPLEAAA